MKLTRDEEQNAENEMESTYSADHGSCNMGFAFVAQRVGIQYIGSFTFTGVRFALGAFTLLPLLIIRNIKDKKTIRMFQ